jgi:hypothetical protein
MNTYESELSRMLREMEQCLEHLEAHSESAAQAEVDFKVSYAKAYMSSVQKTVKDREQDAQLRTEEELLARLVQDRAVTTCREKLSCYRSSIDALRSLIVNERVFSA